jgi:hypothetical protein
VLKKHACICGGGYNSNGSDLGVFVWLSLGPSALFSLVLFLLAVALRSKCFADSDCDQGLEEYCDLMAELSPLCTCEAGVDICRQLGR